MARGTRPIQSFKGRFNFLSNFDESVSIEYENCVYPSVEHAFQAAKTMDPVLRQKIAMAATPSMAKRYGRRVVLRSDWEAIKIDLMKHLLQIKFNDPILRQQLSSLV
jgi:predicted NAD-dependent protein-ADP-ribosyltransferase YbiA (DUF1768 family)